MNERNHALESLQDVKDIRRMMERSSRFISLSGLSGVAAGVCALAGAAVARMIITEQHVAVEYEYALTNLKWQLILLAAATFAVAFLFSLYFTWRKSKDQGVSMWNPVSRRLFWNMMIPLIAGGLFILGLLQHNDWRFVAPSFLVFYGLALVNASKYTLSDIRYLGYCEMALGILNIQWPGYGLHFWAAGFGVLHIIYGFAMWWKYEKGR